MNLRICADVASRAGKGSDSDSFPISKSLLMKDDELLYLGHDLRSSFDQPDLSLGRSGVARSV